jgi:tetratricopeptide (TPR) repeat protein
MRSRAGLGMQFAISMALIAAVVSSVGIARHRSLRRPNEGAGVAQEAEDAHASAGVTTSGLDQVQAAFHQKVESLRRQVQVSPEDRDLLLGLARMLHDGHRPEEAIEHYQAAIRLDPLDGQPYYDLALAYTETGQWQAAGDVLVERLESAPDDAVALYDLGAVRANQGDTLAARSHWVRVMELPAAPDVRMRAERALGQLGGLDPP